MARVVDTGTSIYHLPFTIYGGNTLAEKRTYEMIFIVDPNAADEDVLKLSESVQKIITGQGGSITKTEMMGKRRLAYEINHKRDGIYVLLEVEGSGAEIAEAERRMRVNDQILRYMTVRVDEMRRRADKFKDRRARKAAKQTTGKAKAAKVETESDEEESVA
jgi:small subunit ribosomal protein S6